MKLFGYFTVWAACQSQLAVTALQCRQDCDPDPDNPSGCSQIVANLNSNFYSAIGALTRKIIMRIICFWFGLQFKSTQWLPVSMLSMCTPTFNMSFLLIYAASITFVHAVILHHNTHGQEQTKVCVRPDGIVGALPSFAQAKANGGAAAETWTVPLRAKASYLP